MKTITPYRDLLRERDRNEKAIAKMTRRNKEIDRVIHSVELLFKGTRPEKVTTDPTATKQDRVIENKGLANAIMAAMIDGEPKTTKQIAKFLDMDRDVTHSVAKTCSYLKQKGILMRTKPATYRMKRAKALDKKTQRASVGHDTRVVQVNANHEDRL